MKTRALHPEWMDDPGIDALRHDAALAGLTRINQVSGTVGALWRPLRELARRHGALRVVDLACGGGDVAVALAQRALREGVAIEMHGCDRSARALRAARECADRAAVAVEFGEADVLGNGFPTGFDVYINTLFLHHLTDGQAVALLRRMANGRALILDDLRRSRLGYALAKWGVRLLTRSPVVWSDAPISVLNAFTLDEARSLLERAGLHDAKLDTHWPQRFRITWERR